MKNQDRKIKFNVNVDTKLDGIAYKVRDAITFYATEDYISIDASTYRLYKGKETTGAAGQALDMEEAIELQSFLSAFIAEHAIKTQEYENA